MFANVGSNKDDYEGDGNNYHNINLNLAQNTLKTHYVQRLTQNFPETDEKLRPIEASYILIIPLDVLLYAIEWTET